MAGMEEAEDEDEDESRLELCDRYFVEAKSEESDESEENGLAKDPDFTSCGTRWLDSCRRSLQISYIIDKNVTTHTNHLIYDEEAELYYIKPKNIKKKNKKQYKVVSIQCDQDISNEAGSMLFGPIRLHDKTFISKRPANPTKAMSDWCDVIHKVLLDKA